MLQTWMSKYLYLKWSSDSKQWNNKTISNITSNFITTYLTEWPIKVMSFSMSARQRYTSIATLKLTRSTALNHTQPHSTSAAPPRLALRGQIAVGCRLTLPPRWWRAGNDKTGISVGQTTLRCRSLACCAPVTRSLIYRQPMTGTDVLVTMHCLAFVNKVFSVRYLEY